MKKNIVLCFLILNVFCLFSQSYEQLNFQREERLESKLNAFFQAVIPSNATQDTIIGIYGKPDSINSRNTGYKECQMITYSYSSLGKINFFYKSDEDKIYLYSYNLNSNFVGKSGLPETMDELDTYFDTKFERKIFDFAPDNTYLLYCGKFTVNFIYKNKILDCINWIGNFD